jgi:hypothetical protein
LKAEPLASLDPLFEGRQHALAPERRFGPRPSGADLSGLLSFTAKHWRRWFFLRSVAHALHLPASLGSTPITALRRYYGRSDSWTGLDARPGLPDSRPHPSVRSAANHPPPSTSGFNTLPLSRRASRCRVWASPFTRRLATTTGRIAFVILRTELSPPAASHPASRRRSCSRLRAGERLPGRDFHPSRCVRSQAHECGGHAAAFERESRFLAEKAAQAMLAPSTIQPFSSG